MATKKAASSTTTSAGKPAPAASTPKARRFARSKTDRKIGGVCGGLARYFNLDPTLVRILWVILTLVSFGAGLIGYLLLWWLAPEE